MGKGLGELKLELVMKGLDESAPWLGESGQLEVDFDQGVDLDQGVDFN